MFWRIAKLRVGKIGDEKKGLPLVIARVGTNLLNTSIAGPTKSNSKSEGWGLWGRKRDCPSKERENSAAAAGTGGEDASGGYPEGGGGFFCKGS